MRYSGIILLLLCVQSLHAEFKVKGTPAKDTIKYQDLDTIVVSAKPGLPPYQPSAPRIWEIIHTRVALSFNWKEKTADAREWISLHPYCGGVDTLQMDAKSMRVDSVMLVTKSGQTALSYTHLKETLTIHFGRNFTATDSIQLYLKYTSTPYATGTGGSAAITDDRGLYFINSDNSIPHKPSQIWTQGETESNSHWMITIDKPNTRFTTQIELTVPDSLTTLSNGALTKQIKAAKGMRTDIWKMDMPIQAYVVMFAIGKFSVIKDKWKNKEVNYYVEPEFAPYAKMIFNHTPEMIDFFSKCTGVPYPWNKYSQVVARDYVSGAMENTSASLFGEFMNQNARELADKNSEDVVSHELFHQWFGDYVTCESWTNITVNESFANYGEQLWREFAYGKPYRDELAWDDLQKYIYASRLRDPQLVRFYYDSREEVFDAISYNKGGAILHYLNTLIGNEAFNKAMKLYLTKNALHSAEAHNWRLAVEEATGLDWNWFFNQWYYHAGHPELKVEYTYNDTAGNLGITVRQVQEDSPFLYRLPLKTAIIYGNNTAIVDWTITKRKDTFNLPYISGVKPVVIPDCLHVLPGEIKENKKPWQWLAQFKSTDNYVSKKLAVSAARRDMADSNSQALITLALNDEIKAIRKTVLAQLGSIADKYRSKWTAKVLEMAKTDSDKQVRAQAIELIGKWKIEAGKQLLFAALNDSSYAVAGSALEALAIFNKDTAYAVARQMVNTSPGGNLKTEIWTTIAQSGAENDIDLFEKYALYEQGPKKMLFSYSLNSYLKNVKNTASYKRGLSLFAQLIQLEEKKTYRSSLAGIIAQDAVVYKGDFDAEDKEVVATAKERYTLIKDAFKKIIAEEKDATNLQGYQKIMKDTFDEQ